jgi:hypothetical protein
MTGRLIVVGDSFCVAPGITDPFRNWCQQASTQLEMPLWLVAQPGVSQDWQWDQLQTIFDSITPQDRMVVVPTHCERQWFVADQPAFTHVNCANLPQQLGAEVAEAIRHYCVHLQRPELDLQHQAHRLGWLHAQVHRTHSHPVWVLPAFSLHWVLTGLTTSTPDYWQLFRLNELTNLKLSEHNLYDHVQHREIQPGHSTNTVFQGVDVRYNHMLRHNHEILAHCVVRGIENEAPIDLQDPRWMQQKLHPGIWQDTTFCQQQLDTHQFQHREDILNQFNGTLVDKVWYRDWFKR